MKLVIEKVECVNIYYVIDSDTYDGAIDGNSYYGSDNNLYEAIQELFEKLILNNVYTEDELALLFQEKFS